MSVYGPGRPFKYCPSTCAGVKPPAAPGEYRIRDAAGALLYIGETDNLARRMAEHVRSGKIPSGGTFEYMLAKRDSTSSTRREHEREKIAQHRPLLNRSGGGEGRPSNK